MKGPNHLAVLLVARFHAWMPQDHELQAFKRTLETRDPTPSSIDKRALSLPIWKIRGVNLGGWLISEPWMMRGEWADMGCGHGAGDQDDECSEFDSVNFLGQSQADTSFDAHYARWITPSMVQDIQNAGLNTIRIPIGYWALKSLVESRAFSEYGSTVSRCCHSKSG